MTGLTRLAGGLVERWRSWATIADRPSSGGAATQGTGSSHVSNGVPVARVAGAFLSTDDDATEERRGGDRLGGSVDRAGLFLMMESTEFTRVDRAIQKA